MDRREGEVCKRARVLRGTSDGGGGGKNFVLRKK